MLELLIFHESLSILFFFEFHDEIFRNFAVSSIYSNKQEYLISFSTHNFSIMSERSSKKETRDFEYSVTSVKSSATISKAQRNIIFVDELDLVTKNIVRHFHSRNIKDILKPEYSK